MHSITILDGLQTNPGDLSWKGFEEYGELKVFDYLTYNEEEIIHRISDSDIVITVDTPVTDRVLSRCPRIVYVGAMATGHNHIDKTACAKRGIIVTNVPSYSTSSVSQRTIALLMELSDRVGTYDRAIHEGLWNGPFAHWDIPSLELEGKTLGIIGYGAIGRRTASIANAMGMRILAYSRHLQGKGDNTALYYNIDSLLKEADVISLHLPLNIDSRHIINRQSIAKMKDGVLLINTSRGELIDEEALSEALLSGKVGGAALDVLSTEPPNENNPLLKTPNTFITPHTAWTGRKARETLINETIENLKSFLEGKERNIVKVDN